MRNLLFRLRFRGTAYHGFQVQKNALTVCEVFQDAVQSVIGCRPDVKGCSRTDAGVHALEFCVSMRTSAPIPCDRLIPALNHNLPDDIAVTDCREVGQDFHARYSAIGKEYQYRIHNSWVRDPFSTDLACRVSYHLDEQFLHAQAQDFVGTHDFQSFCAGGSGVRNTVRTIFSFSAARQEDTLLLTVHGDGFLYHMVRIMAGTLLDIATGKLPEDSIPAILDARDRRLAGRTAPAHGLYLARVFYDSYL